jgi:predicted nucleotidyltransferase
MNTQPEVIGQIAERFSRIPHVEKVISFGSRARGDEEERSDIDLAVVGPDITRDEWREMRDYVGEKARTLLFIDLLRFEHAPPDLQESIIKEGVTLYERH